MPARAIKKILAFEQFVEYKFKKLSLFIYKIWLNIFSTTHADDYFLPTDKLTCFNCLNCSDTYGGNFQNYYRQFISLYPLMPLDLTDHTTSLNYYYHRPELRYHTLLLLMYYLARLMSFSGKWKSKHTRLYPIAKQSKSI